MKDERPVHIYVLLEGWSDEVRYVGQTTRPKQRFRDHERATPLPGEENSLKRAWVDEAHGRGVAIHMRTIETCTREKADEREAYWVEHYRAAGHRLTNSTEGGAIARWIGKAKAEVQLAPLTPQEILALWIAAWDGYRAIVDDSMFLARPYHDQIEAVRDYLADKPALTQDLDAMRLTLPGDYPMFRELTKEEWLEKAAQFDAEEALVW